MKPAVVGGVVTDDLEIRTHEIEWGPAPFGGGFRGSLGGIPIWSMSWRGGPGPKWWLGCSLPGIKDHVKVDTEEDGKARAARQLESFLAKITEHRDV